MRIKTKKGAIELSINTIVIIVLAMSMLILGLVLIRGLFSGASDTVTALNEQTITKINEQFGSEDKTVIYPISQKIEVRQDKEEGFGLGIRNKLKGTGADSEFAYEVSIASPEAAAEECGITEEEIMSLILKQTVAESGISMPTGDDYQAVILFQTTTGDPFCTVKFRVEVTADGKPYDTKSVLVTFTD